MSNQDFEIIALDHPDYLERLEAINYIDDFETLEQIYVSDEYITVRMKAFDKLSELYERTKKFKTLKKIWNKINGYSGWIPFIISELGRGNNIESTISYILSTKKYLFNDDTLFQSIVDVALHPIKSDGYYSKDGIEIRWTDYGPQYHYEMVIRILIKKSNGMFDHEYVFIRCWNANPDTHEKFAKKLTFYESEE